MWRKIAALRVLLPKKAAWGKILWLGSVLSLLILAFCWGRFGAQKVSAQNPSQTHNAANGVSSEAPPDPGRPVAYIYNSVPVTRQDLGEYLIARFGAERVEFLVNRKIIEMTCRKAGVYVTDAEVEAQLVDDLKKMNVPSLEIFEKQVLKRFGKSLYEYREDVLRPKLALAKLCRQNIQVTEQDLLDEFEAKYGAKIECKMIVFLPEQVRLKLPEKVWADLKAHPETWDKCVKEYCQVPQIAANGGTVPPIHKHFGDKRIEDQAFGMKDGEISTLLPMSDGTVVLLRRIKELPPDTTREITKERLELKGVVFERKLAKAIPDVFKEMKNQAQPRIFLEAEEIEPSFARRIDRALQAAYKMRAQQQRPGSLTGN